MPIVHKSSQQADLSFAARLFGVGGLLFSTLAAAHAGHDDMGGLAAGMLHPIGGLDHVLAMVAIGLWARQLPSRAALLAVPSAFLVLMSIGGLLYFAGLRLPDVEPLALASVVVLGLLIATAVQLPPAACAAIAGGFALFHGYLHVNEMPQVAAPLSYACGFLLSTALLHLSGIGLAHFMIRAYSSRALRWAGSAVAVAGATLSLI